LTIIFVKFFANDLRISIVLVTTVRNKPKAFSWSYSKLKNYETCPKRYHAIDVTKSYKEEEGEALQWGNAVHKALAERIAEPGKPLPKGMEHFEKWAESLLETGGTILVEQKLAINSSFGPTSWFGDDAWYRGIGDVIKIIGSVALIIDWKTGKIIEDGSQLALMAQCVFAHYPEVRQVRSEFVWLKEDASTRADFKRDDMMKVWAGLWPRVEALETAHKLTEFPPKPGGLCKRWCVVQSCPHHGT
jgi:hypothetical protein